MFRYNMIWKYIHTQGNTYIWKYINTDLQTYIHTYNINIRFICDNMQDTCTCTNAHVRVLMHVPFGAWWLIGRYVAFRPKGRGFESCSSRNVGTLGKSFTHSCLWRFGVKHWHSIRAVFEAPLSSSGLEEML